MLSGILVAAGVIAAFVAEQSRDLEHAPPKVRIITGVAIALVFIIPAMLLEWRAKKAAAKAAAPVPRPMSTFGPRR